MLFNFLVAFEANQGVTLNAEAYANNSKICDIEKATGCFSYTLLYRNLLLDVGNKKLEEKSTKSDVERITEAIIADALETCKLKLHSSAIHLMALTNVIGYPIVSVYPISAKLVAPRELFHGIYLPRDQEDATNVKSTSRYLL